MTQKTRQKFAKIQKITKIRQKKSKQLTAKNNDDNVRNALELIMSLKTNIYQRIYTLTMTDQKEWRQFDFLSSESKIESFIKRIEQEIKSVKSQKFDFDKYKIAIYHILNLEKPKFNEEIVKNMYIAKLQNIIYLLTNNNDNDIKEVQENKQTNNVYR